MTRLKSTGTYLSFGEEFRVPAWETVEIEKVLDGLRVFLAALGSYGSEDAVLDISVRYREAGEPD